jgi:ubiquinone/menaquinone biosynthesis C-methylase UbiE
MEKAYRVAKWLDPPGNREASKRFLQIKSEFEKIIKHRWVSEALKGRESFSILDLCGAWGIAGIAISKVLRQEKMGTSLTILDLRRDSEEVARSFVKEELGEEPAYIVADATKLHDIGEKFDIAVLWGMSTSHFDPWGMTKLLAGVSNNLADDGLLLIEETDRTYTTFLSGGYTRFYVEGASEEKTVVSLHSGYDSRRGVVKKVIVDLVSGEKALEDIHLWGLAEMAQMLWMFFGDVDFIPRDQYRGVLIAKGPRKEIFSKSFLDSSPSFLSV